MKKILLLNGSPRKNGQTNTLLIEIQNQCLEYIKSLNKESEITIEMLQISDYPIKFCDGCDSCLRKPNVCPKSDEPGDSMNLLEEKVTSSNALIIGAPSYFGSMPAQLKVFVDRSRPWKMAKYKLKNIVFSAVASAGLANGGLGSTLEGLHSFAFTHAMVVLPAAGTPQLIPNLVSSTLQGNGVKEFRTFDQLSEVAASSAKALAQRIVDYIISQN